MVRNTILSFFKSSRNPGCLKLNAIFSVILILGIIVLFPLMGHAFEDSLEKDVQKVFEQGRAIVLTIQNKLLSGSSVSGEIAQLKTTAENIRISNLLMEERFKLREEKVKGLGSKAAERHQAIAEGYRKALTEYLSIIDGLPSSSQESPRTGQASVGSQEKINKLKTLLDKLITKKKKPIIGSLPYKHLNLPAIEPSTAPEITPAYKGGNKIVFPDDTKSTPEAPISKEIAALAQSLNWQPMAIYEHVKNTVETEWYWGCQKGAEETLRQKSGNDCDQALLLSSLLKASGFPTRLVRGNIQFFASDDKPLERVKNLIGIDDPAKMAEFFQKAGIPYKPIIAGGKIANFEISHIYVESQIPYANYRGIVIDEHGKIWLGLDTAIKTTDYVYNNPNDLFEQPEPGDRLSRIRDEYLALNLNSQPSTTQPATPLEYLQSRINSELTAQNAQLTYNDFLRTKTLTPEPMKFLPASLQFNLIKATGEYTEIPDELVHKVKIQALDANKSELFNITLPLYRLSNQQIAITYEPETVEDQEIIDSYGGLDNTPSYLIRLRPVLKINGERIVATDGLPMGAYYNLRIELYSPSVNEGATPAETITNNMITGNLSVIGITAQKAGAEGGPVPYEATPQSGGEGEKDAERLLYESAQHYIDRWNKTEDELASLLHLTLARPLPTVVTLGGMIDVTYLLDMPHGFTWKGVYVDADLRAVEAVHRTPDPDNRTRLFMQLSSLQGSILENRVFEDDFKVESISTAKLFQLLNSELYNSQLVTIDKTNIDAILHTLPFDDNIKEDIINSVNQNFTIRIPFIPLEPGASNGEIVYHDWTGIGFIKENSETGESGWMLSGMIAGGMTVWSDDRWPQYFIDVLSNPYAEPASYDPASAKFIQKVTTTDLPTGIVGTQLTHPLQVVVHTDQMQPVSGVNVTFTVKAGGGSLSGTDSTGNPVSGTTITVPTNPTGIASVLLTLGQKTSSNPTFWYYPATDTTRPYPEQVGENLVDAALPSGTRISTPFAAYGFPKAARSMRALHGDGLASTILFLSGFVSIITEDEYRNPISNLPVKFEALDPDTVPESMNCNPDITKKAYFIRTDEPCLSSAPVWGDCGLVSQQTLTFYTHSRGAQAEVMLGGVPYAVYPIKATCTDTEKCIEPATNELLHADFKHYTYNYNCGTTLHMQTLYPTDPYGNNINAGKTGTQIPVMAKLYALINSAVTTTFDSAAVTFNSQPGTAEANGVFRGAHTLTTGLNWIDARGSAIINGSPYNASVMIPVYGVDIAISPPTLILLDSFGYAKMDTVIPFTIAPAEYTAMTAYMVILKNGEAIEYIPVETHGQGTAIIGRGFWFDINSSYSIQVKLNISTGVEISSSIQPLKIIMFDIVKPADSDKILIKNDSNGNPKMEPLTARVELKSSGINPAVDLTSQKICWKFKVEYLVDTKVDKRDRNGLNSGGAGNGTDGYLIPAYPLPPAPGQLDCIDRDGATFTIDETGTSGMKWDTNFGGGVLTITAKTKIDGIDVTDMHVGKIEGETFSTAFKNQLTSYLEDPDSDHTSPTIRGEVGYDKFFRVIAYIETRYRHFYPSIYGTPKSANYPRENELGDGGFGVMQLTQWGNPSPYPTYNQIWNYKENINKAVDLIRSLLVTAKGYPGIVRTRGCTKEPYYDTKKEKWIYPCRPMPTTKKYVNALDFDEDELRVDLYSLYNSNWHYWIWNDKKGDWVPYTSDIESQQKGSAYADAAEEIKDNPPADF